MALDNNNNIYLAYRDILGRLVLQKYSTNSWSTNLISENYSTGELDIGTDLNNDVFIAFQDLETENANTKLSVLKYDSSVEAFSFIGGRRFTSGNTRKPTLEIDRDGTVIVGFREANIVNNDSESLLRPTVMKYTEALWNIVDDRGFTKEIVPSTTSDSALITSLTTDFTKDIFFGYTDFQNDNKALIVRSVARKLNNINTSITLDASKNIYMAGHNDERKVNDLNNILAKD